MTTTKRNTLKTMTLTDPGTTGTAYDWSGKDDETVLVCVTAAANSGLTLTVLAGNAQTASGNLTLDISTAGTHLCKLDSARFKNVTGTNKGKIVVKASTAAKCTVGTARLA